MLTAHWTESVNDGWEGDSLNGNHKWKQVPMNGEIVGYVSTYEADVSAIIFANNTLHSVRFVDLVKVNKEEK